MTREEFKISVEDSFHKADKLFKLIPHNVHNAFLKNEKYLEFFSSFDFIGHILDDLENDFIPESFYDVIVENIKSLNLDAISFSIIEEIENLDDLTLLEKVLLNTNIQAVYGHRHLYRFFQSLGFAKENTVIVGANGSGKTSLASMLKDNIPSKSGIVIPSQKLLVIPTLSSIPNYSITSKEFDVFQGKTQDFKITYNTTKGDDFPYPESKEIASEFNIILRNLIAERISINNRYCEKVKNEEKPEKEELISTLDKALSIWNSLIEHRELFCDENTNLKVKVKKSDAIYSAYQMSDGEKVILYLIARVVLAPSNGFIITDEPELYLHKSIVDKLWNKLEFERQDCIFIYMTHDLDFASSRVAKKYWIKSFKHPMSWDIEPIPNNGIPENLLMELLGSRKKVLFCEGEAEGKSLDLTIYETLFPEYTIRPVRTCGDVINYTKAFNAISDKNVTACGIIDRDFRSEEQLKILASENIYSLNVAEVENLFLAEDFISAFVRTKGETCNIDEIKNNVIKKLDADLDLQASNYVSNRINYYFKESHVKRGNSKVEIESKFKTFIDKIKIEEWHKDRTNELKQIITDNDYKKSIMIYNNKGLHTVIEGMLGYKSGIYRDKALCFLQNNENAKEILRNYFPTQLKTGTKDG